MPRVKSYSGRFAKKHKKRARSHSRPKTRKTAKRRNTGRISGKGDYTVAGPGMAHSIENQLVKGSGMKPLHFQSTGNLTGDVIVEHREFVDNVYAVVKTGGSGASPFRQQVYSINPGLANSFPWLSQLASNFTLYEFEGLCYEYRPTSGEFGTTNSNALGKVVMTTQYDPDAPNFTNSIEMENYDYAVSAKPSNHMLHGVECKNKQRFSNQLYLRTGATARDYIFTDVGEFAIATEGVQLTGTAQDLVPVGELWVAYKVKLSRARIYSSILGLASSSDGASGLFSTTQTIVATPNPKNSVGTTCYLLTASLKQLQVNFPPTVNGGYYYVKASIFQSAASTAVFTSTCACANAILGNPFNIDTGVPGINTASPVPANVLGAADNIPEVLTSATATKSISATTIVKVVAPGNAQASVTFNISAVMTALDAAYFEIYQIPNNLLLF